MTTTPMETDPMDLEILLITAYLTGELTLIEWAAVDERLATDVEFRERVQPILDVWSHPVRFESEEAAVAIRAMDAKRKDPKIDALAAAGWQRFLQEEAASQPVFEEKVKLAVTRAAVSVRNTVRQTVQGIIDGMPRAARLTLTTSFGTVLFFAAWMTVHIPIMRLDHLPNETMSDRGKAWLHRTVVQPSVDTRRIELGGGSVVTLGANSTLTFRPAVQRLHGEVMNVEGTAVIEVSAGAEVAALFTPAAIVALTPGRYVVQSVDAKTPMVIGVESGSADVRSRGGSTTLTLSPGQYAQAVLGHAAVLLPAAPPGLPPWK